VGAFVPALIAVAMGAAYLEYSDHLIVREGMQGARAGALAVFAWAIVRLVRPQIQQHRRRGFAIAFGTLLITLALPIPQFMILLIAGGVGAALL
jgi:chromate transport protein ChrA